MSTCPACDAYESNVRLSLSFESSWTLLVTSNDSTVAVRLFPDAKESKLLPDWSLVSGSASEILRSSSMSEVSIVDAVLQSKTVILSSVRCFGSRKCALSMRIAALQYNWLTVVCQT